MSTVTLDAFGIVVADMARSVAFYRALGLDFPEGAAQQGHAEATLGGGVRLMLDTHDIIRSFAPEWTPPTGGHRMGLAVRCESPAAVDATYAALTSAGHPGTKEPWNAFWGQRYAQVSDPDGNPVDLYAALPA